MRYLCFIEQDAVLEFAGVAHHDSVTGDDVFADVTPAADVAILSDPGRALQDRALLDDCSTTDKDRVANEWFPHQFAEHHWFQAKLEIAGNLFQSVPDIF